MDRLIKASALVLITTACSAQAQEFQKKVWYCDEVQSAGMSYNSSRWEVLRFHTDRFVIKQISPTNFVFPKNLDMFNPSCELSTNKNYVTCSDFSSMFILNTISGNASRANVGGWSYSDENPPDRTDSLSVSALKCETF